MNSWFRFSMLAIQIVSLLSFTQNLKAQSLRKATFELKNEITVQVPDGAKRVRVWTALPQDDPAQEIKNLKIEAPYPYRVELDSEGSKVLFLEGDAPKEKELKIVTSFVLTRSEVRSGVDAKKAKPISEADRVRLAHYLQPNKHVIIDGDIRKLALEIVGNEQNPVLAARKLYDWLLENVE
jgi:transglutaminase-like putative cysteine protease